MNLVSLVQLVSILKLELLMPQGQEHLLEAAVALALPGKFEVARK